MHLIGLDIGFAQGRRTNAIAELAGDDLTINRLTIDERNQALSAARDVDVIAIDAPILPIDAPSDLIRECERTFTRGLFQTRCKPGMSHVRGTGTTFRAHGRMAGQHATLAASCVQKSFPRVLPGTNVVEAFPNTFLGVALPESAYRDRPSLRRGQKFDWLYDQWVARNLFQNAAELAELPAIVAEACERERDHEKRAAFICLLTAAFARIGRYIAVGDEIAGYFFLPPRTLWADWSQQQLRKIVRTFDKPQIVE